MNNEQFGLHNPEPVIRTYTGKFVNVFDPHPDMFCIEDIAHALSMMPRWGGHCAWFFSVAQHSSNCAFTLPAKHKCQSHQLAALMHDASEAYLMDIPRPIKKKLSNYAEIEDAVMKVISAKFGFEYPMHPVVKATDEHNLEQEWEHLIIKRDYKEIENYCLTPQRAKSVFMRDFKNFTL